MCRRRFELVQQLHEDDAAGLEVAGHHHKVHEHPCSQQGHENMKEHEGLQLQQAASHPLTLGTIS